MLASTVSYRPGGIGIADTAFWRSISHHLVVLAKPYNASAGFGAFQLLAA